MKLYSMIQCCGYKIDLCNEFDGSTCGNGFGGPVLMGSSSICLVTERNNALINISYATITRRATEVPIPGTLMLLLIGFAAVAFQMRRRTN
jgi:hypothetical protein